MNKIILFQALVVLASAEVPTGDHSAATNRVLPDPAPAVVTPGTNHWTNTNAAPAFTHSPATNPPAIPGASTGLQAPVN